MISSTCWCRTAAARRHNFEEMFTLLEGEVKFTFRGQTMNVSEGAAVNIPANAPHQFRNDSGKTVHMLCMCTPAGQEEFFAEVGDRFANRNSPPPQLSAEEKADAGKGPLSWRRNIGRNCSSRRSCRGWPAQDTWLHPPHSSRSQPRTYAIRPDRQPRQQSSPPGPRAPSVGLDSLSKVRFAVERHRRPGRRFHR